IMWSEILRASILTRPGKLAVDHGIDKKLDIRAVHDAVSVHVREAAARPCRVDLGPEQAIDEEIKIVLADKPVAVIVARIIDRNSTKSGIAPHGRVYRRARLPTE